MSYCCTAPGIFKQEFYLPDTCILFSLIFSGVRGIDLLLYKFPSG